MLKIYELQDLSQEKQSELCVRNADDGQTISKAVRDIIAEVRSGGDQALLDLAERFDGRRPEKLCFDKEEIRQFSEGVNETERQALNTAFGNIWKFHAAQKTSEEIIVTSPGVNCWREARAIEKVGLYIPGGSAVLPSTFLMLGIPARIAGCSEIIVCSPPQKDGKLNPYLAYCAVLLNIERIYLSGGAQAVAAMAYGTESIPKVDKIFGPGNQYVTQAKNIIQSESRTAIDMPAGPSEVLIIADEEADPVFVAADLLAQAEHGPDSQAILLSNSRSIVEQTLAELELQVRELPREEIARKALGNSYAILCPNLNSAMEFSNRYAPEHLILLTEHWREIISGISNAGSVFLGHYSPESVGDYASGTNHTLPTSSYARAYSGVSLDSFVKKITFQQLSEEGIREIGPAVEVLAGMEGLQAHKNAVSVRLNKLNQDSVDPNT